MAADWGRTSLSIFIVIITVSVRKVFYQAKGTKWVCTMRCEGASSPQIYEWPCWNWHWTSWKEISVSDHTIKKCIFEFCELNIRQYKVFNLVREELCQVSDHFIVHFGVLLSCGSTRPPIYSSWLESLDVYLIQVAQWCWPFLKKTLKVPVAQLCSLPPRTLVWRVTHTQHES